MMGYIWFGIIFIAVAVAGIQGTMDEVTTGALDSAKASVTLAIGLIGVMSLFLGVMKVAQDAGLLKVIARAIRPVMVWLFPDVPPDHPAMSAMIMNMSANMLGLANAATPFGIKAMMELEKLNKHKGTATNAMVLFLAINTSNVTLLPTGVIGIRHAAESADAAGILLPTLFATCCSTMVAILVTKLLQRLRVFRLPPAPVATEDEADAEPAAADGDGIVDEALAAQEASALAADARSEAFWRIASPLLLLTIALGFITIAVLCFLFGIGTLATLIEHVSPWIIPMILLSLLSYGLSVQVVDKIRGREPRLEVYSSFVEGAKEGWGVAKKIIPYLVAILVAVGMFRASGALDLLTAGISPITGPIGLPAEALPMALLRPLSGSGAFGYMAEVVNTSGPDTYLGYLVSTMQGSTETTFYVIAVYFGAVGVSKLRHAIPSALTADMAGVAATVFICLLMFGHLRGEPAPATVTATMEDGSEVVLVEPVPEADDDCARADDDCAQADDDCAEPR